MEFLRGPGSLCCLLLLVHGALSAADAYLSPAFIAGARLIDTEGLIALVGTREDLVIIDSRIRQDHAEGFIETSRHLVDRDTNCDSLARLLPGKASPMVFYCNGVNCDRSDRAVVIAPSCGYTEIYWFRGGVEEWREKNYALIQ